MLTLTVSFGGLALAAPNFILRVKGDNLQKVAQAHGLTLQRQLFRGAGFSVGLVSGSATGDLAKDSNVAGVESDAVVPAKNPIRLSLSQAGMSMQAWLLSLQNAQQKNNTFLNQPGLNLIHAPYGSQGAGATVAVIDTAVDPNQPLLAGKLLPAVDCVSGGVSNACAGTVGSIWGDPTLDQSTVVILDQSTVVILDQSTVVILDQSTVVILDSQTGQALNGKTLASDFGHGTMVSTLIAATAPGAKILPIRAFNADGSSNLSDIVAAIYYAADHGANVINMSFDVTTNSQALADAISYAAGKGAICVASGANQNGNVTTYPAAYNGQVIGVGSVGGLTGLFKSDFSSYGQPSIDVYAPGENLIAGFPGGHYAVVSGTSFAAALASGTAATLVSTKASTLVNYMTAETKTGATVLFPYDGTRRLDVKAAVNGLN